MSLSSAPLPLYWAISRLAADLPDDPVNERDGQEFVVLAQPSAQEHIRYYLHLNLVFNGVTIDPYPHQFSVYLTLGALNTIEVDAEDEAGNRSAPAAITIDLRNR